MNAIETLPKHRMIEIIQSQPDDSSYDEILRELAFARMIELGLADLDAGRTVSSDEVKRRIESWQK
jgi:predicted transcriptional regulator